MAEDRQFVVFKLVHDDQVSEYAVPIFQRAGDHSPAGADSIAAGPGLY
jgi:hypothetical protein